MVRSSVRLRMSLNGVRPRRPEQYPLGHGGPWHRVDVSMESGLEDRNNRAADSIVRRASFVSQWSPA